MNSTAEEILKMSEKYRDYTSRNLSKLVQTPSTSGNEKQAILELKKMMEDVGFEEVKIDGLGNIIGHIGNGEKVLAIDAHIDTVGVGNLKNWDFDPFSGEIKEGFVLGRGSVDQKGGAAAFITAGKILKELGVPENIRVYFVGSVMEEDCEGLCWKYIIEEDKINPDIVISTEPTDLNIYRGHRGRMEIEVAFDGISSHGSIPERGKNAIYMASHLSLEIENLNKRLKKDEFLGKGTTVVTQLVSKSPSLCAVPDYAKIHIDRRLTWGESKESALNEIVDIVDRSNSKVNLLYYEKKSYTGLKYSMEKYFPTWKLPENHPVILFAANVYRLLFRNKPKIGKWNFSTNGVTINGVYDIPVLGFGPGNEVMAHAPNEKVKTDDLVKASAFYALYPFLMQA